MYSIILKRMLTVSVAFIVFGIVDNGIMILAGTAIDSSIGVAFGLSMMASAALGNTLSDAIGIASGRWIEHELHRFLPMVQKGELSKKQIIFAETMGIIVGCLLGMLPLFFL